MVYDYIIVGAGIAGLYTGLKLLKTKKSFLILEKSNRYGGRAYNEKFSGMRVPTGAGVGRFEKDKLLIRLMKSLDLPIETFPVQHNYSEKALEHKVDIRKIFAILKREYYAQHQPQISFKKFFIQILGKELFKDFKIYNGYTDMLDEDVYQSLYYYGIEDNYTAWKGFKVDWNMLVKRMVETIQAYNPTGLKRNQNITEISSTNEGWKVISNSKAYYCEKLVMATTIDAIEQFFPFYRAFGIEAQPFLRTYIQLDKPSSEIVKSYVLGTTIVSNVFQKIIPMNPDKGIYMIAYSDNDSAIRGRTFNKSQIIKQIQKEFGFDTPLKILKSEHFFWKVGTHYYKFRPDKRRQNPVDHLYVVGESVSLNQGWVEGALESVDKVFKKLVY